MTLVSPTISLRDQKVTICIEMPENMWTDEFMNYTCRDLCAGGRLFENPDLLNISEDHKDRIRRGNFLVTPTSAEQLRLKNSCLTGYICITDTSNGMRINHTWRDIRK